MTAAELIAKYGVAASPFFHGTAKPYVRWWWLAGPFTQQDIATQLRWVREAGFGGVELAWIYPSWLEDEPGLRPEWLGPEWTDLVAFARRTAEELELGCDFTFGSCWPFGGSWLAPENAAQSFDGASEQRLGCSWEQPAQQPTPVLNHLSAAALEHYSRPLFEALTPAMKGIVPGLFCDSLELRTEAMWSKELWEVFERRFGYSLRPFAGRLDENAHVRYDYRELIADTIGREFYQAFSDICRRNYGYARVQCHGAPTDLLAAYAAVDVPESESLLFRPQFSRIAASAAAWAGKQIVSAEAFTCVYGFPRWEESAETYWRKENVEDLKLLADSLFAHGVNHIVWHGMPYQPAGSDLEFYASVHVGPDSVWAPQLPAFNRYLEEISAVMRMGQAYGGLGVYLPFEDALMQDRLPDEERTPGANYRWEMRHAQPPLAMEGFHPMWISDSFLREARVVDGRVYSRQLGLDGLYVDCEWLDEKALVHLVRLAEEGARIVCTGLFKQPGYQRDKAPYQANLAKLLAISKDIADPDIFTPLLVGEDLPFHWARTVGKELLLFLAHPQTRKIGYPMEYGLGLKAGREDRQVMLQWRGRKSRLDLQFQRCQSLLIFIDEQGSVQQIETSNFRPQ